MIEIAYVYAYFIIYAFLGWVCEDIYCGIGKRQFINRGFLYGPYCPIYGVGALLVLYPLLLVGYHPALVFLVGMFITTALEYITSYVMEKLFHTRWWDYSSYPLNLNGRICLKNSLLFGILCMVVVFVIHPRIMKFVMHINDQLLYVLLVLFTIGFGIDLFLTIKALLKRKKVLQKIKEDVDAFRVEFEKEKQIKLDEMADAFEEFVKDNPRLEARLDKMKQAVTYLDKVQKMHIAHAFPNRKLNDDLKELVTFVQSFKEKSRKVK